MAKHFISPNELRSLSWQLASQVTTRPDFIVALWRGGATIGCYVHEFLMRQHPNHKFDHIAIRTSRYTGVDTAEEHVQVDGLEYIFKKALTGHRILIIDDVWDAGTTIAAVVNKLSTLKVSIQVGVIFFKHTRNKMITQPDYYVSTSDRWLVFPHELEGLTEEEIHNNQGL